MEDAEYLMWLEVQHKLGRLVERFGFLTIPEYKREVKRHGREAVLRKARAAYQTHERNLARWRGTRVQHLFRFPKRIRKKGTSKVFRRKIEDILRRHPGYVLLDSSSG